MSAAFIEGELELGSALALKWKDGRRQSLNASFLRAQCPCETCKLTKPRLEPSAFPGISVDSFSPVGRYALQLRFSDGHGHGAYSFDLLQSFADEV